MSRTDTFHDPLRTNDDFNEAVYEHIKRACDADKRTRGLTESTSLLTLEDCIYGFMSLPINFEERRYVHDSSSRR